jgi:hypothetical protein
VDLAAAGEGDEVRLLLAPPRQGRRPLPRPAQLQDLLAGEDHPAVDDPGDDRREGAFRDRHHRLVQQPQAVPRPARVHEELPLRVEREREEVPVAEPLADLRSRSCGRAGAVDIALGLVLEGDRHEQVPLLRTLTLVFEQALGTAEPARRRPHLSAHRELHADPERAARGRAALAVPSVPLGRSLEDPHLLVFAAEHVGGDCEALEIRRDQQLGAFQQFVRLRPGALREGLPSFFEHAATTVSEAAGREASRGTRSPSPGARAAAGPAETNC